MVYRKQLFPLMVMVSVMVFVGISPAFAKVCPVGKVAVTIVNPANKVIEICVPPVAIDTIGGGGDIVISATCPCYSQDDLDSIWNAGQPFTCYVASGTTKLSNSPCTYVHCVYPIPLTEDPEVTLQAWEGIPTDEGGMGGDSCALDFPSDWPFIAYKIPNGNGCYEDAIGEIYYPEITEEQGKACVAILKTFVTSP